MHWRKTGLIIPIGEWVLDEACRQMRLWYAQGYESWRIAVNLSALQFCHAGLVNSVAAALELHHLPANSLTLEITETTAMSDADASMTVLQQLSDMGVDLSIDDFGTGYSSLMYLKRLPANELKIDRGFVRDLEHDSDDAAIVSAIVALGRPWACELSLKAWRPICSRTSSPAWDVTPCKVSCWGTRCQPTALWPISVAPKSR